MADRQRTDRTDVTLPEDVVERVDARLPRSGFDSVDDYVATALDVLLREVDRQERGAQAGDGDETTASDTTTASDDAAVDDASRGSSVDSDDAPDRESVEDQLESLGYL